ncbi:MAG: cytochrome ubiquinol oxidase subunit I [Syntrophaceae bacterium CG2_30_49_12]|nr:MAG: cytochrome ubiquinol oxidase subunit I [Syntrophaceae bacterium CG2_30_49_12]PIP06118.1 MAG: cytochrome ubiquinol oxidase subunit I [Syntrophobacterales bacterium CG23_combo_of_CG06-09_8_20_14_all_48_27]PJA49973.1 MAG: cytochrome ubiquinol oxidase subunit I [Syntrophobacterales bacterium CG_4_9_14_3_um_filter_49_8]
MDVLLLSRLQFAVATFFHFLFVPLTLGLSVLVAIMETRYVKTGDETYLKMTRFWGKLFLINFVIGIVTGITLEFQFGTNWSRYSAFMGDIFGSLLAIEALGFFFLESTLIGVWLFGWRKISKGAHAIVMWLVAFASTGSAVWILTANAWMQHPVGYVIRNGRAELESFAAVALNKTGILMILHTISAAYILSAFFVMGISAYHLLKKQHVAFFTKSFRLALVFGLIFSLFEIWEGHLHGRDLAENQPTKLAAMESHWETSRNAPIYFFAFPDEAKEKNSTAIGPLPGMLSLLAFHRSDAEVKGLKDYPRDERPPVLISFGAFRLMVVLGFYFALVTLWGWFKKNRLVESPRYLKLMLFSLPLPYIAAELGWILAEMGRQPWIVYGLMKTRDAVSPLATSQVTVTLVAFILLYGFLGAVGYFLIIKNAKKGPVAD